MAVAVNVADEPAHSGFVPEVCAIETEAATDGLTTIVMEFEFAGLPLIQLPLDVIWHVITSPLLSEAIVNVELLVPTFVTPSFH